MASLHVLFQNGVPEGLTVSCQKWIEIPFFSGGVALKAILASPCGLVCRKHLNGLVASVREHRRYGHPCFVPKPATWPFWCSFWREFVFDVLMFWRISCRLFFCLIVSIIFSGMACLK